MACENREAGLDVIAATEAILRCDDAALSFILDSGDTRAMASMACSVLAAVLGGTTADPETVLGRFRAHFSGV